MTRDALVLAAQAGEPAALAGLVERHQTQVYTLCLAIMRHPADAADMTQDTFLRLLRVLPSFRDGSFSSWLHRITVNVCLDELRRRRKGNVSLDANGDEAAFDVPSGEVWDEPAWRAEWRESANEVRAAMRELPLPQRVALTLHYFDGSSYDEVAAVMQLPLNTVKSHLLRGKQRMAKLLAEPTEQPARPKPCVRPAFDARCRLKLVAA